MWSRWFVVSVRWDDVTKIMLQVLMEVFPVYEDGNIKLFNPIEYSDQAQRKFIQKENMHIYCIYIYTQ